MHHWKASRNGLTLSATTTSVHTSRNNRDNSTKETCAIIRETLAIIRDEPNARFAFDMLTFEYPILNKQSRFKRTDCTWGYVSNLDVALLLASGYYHREIAEYLQTARLNVTRIALKIKASFEPIRSSQRPYQATGNVSEKPDDDSIIENISYLLSSYDHTEKPLPKHAVSQIQYLLDDDTRRTNRRYERKTISLGVGKAAEEKLDKLLHSNSDSGKVTKSRIRDRHKGRFDADQLLENYWKGTWDRPWYQENSELAIRIKHIAMNRAAGLSPCQGCEDWLRMDSFCRPWNNSDFRIRSIGIVRNT